MIKDKFNDARSSVKSYVSAGVANRPELQGKIDLALSESAAYAMLLRHDNTQNRIPITAQLKELTELLIAVELLGGSQDLPYDDLMYLIESAMIGLHPRREEHALAYFLAEDLRDLHEHFVEKQLTKLVNTTK